MSKKYQLPTVAIRLESGKRAVINATDFDPEIHTEWDGSGDASDSGPSKEALAAAATPTTAAAAATTAADAGATAADAGATAAPATNAAPTYDRAALEAEANELKIAFRPSISDEKLAERIAEHKAA